MYQIFGRDKIIKSIWAELEERSIIFVAERRVGKTTVLQELKKEHKEGLILVFSDLEKISTPIGFVEEVLNSVSEYLKFTDKLPGWFENLKSALGGLEILTIIKFPEAKEKDWQTILVKAVTAICKNTDKQVIFLWDEVPYMLQKIHKEERTGNSTKNSALEILDTLRSLRQSQSNLRMILTGSIGLHHILTELTTGLSAEPVNDMPAVELHPLDKKSAKEMAQHLLKKEEVNCQDEAIIEPIIKQCDYVPFYIEKLIKRLSLYEEKVTIDTVHREIIKIIVDPNDELEMAHFRTRLADYYLGTIQDVNGQPIEKSNIARTLLNHFAVAGQPQSIDDCNQAIKSNYKLENRNEILSILDSLAKDHYIQRDTQGNYRFRFSLIRRWWVMAEGLTEQGGNNE